MTPVAYLKDRMPAVCIVLICALAIGSAVATLGAGTDAAVLLSLFVVLSGAGGFLWDYLRIRRFYRELGELAARLTQPCLMPSLLEEPLFLEGRLTFEAIESASKAAADEVTRYRDQAESYRDYIELWIHEIKTPIAAACLISASSHGSEANRLKGELDRIEAYVEQALYYARSTSLARDYAIREVDLAVCVRKSCKKHARYLIEQGATPDIRVPDGERVFADEKWLSFVLGQLIVNAAKFGAVRIGFSSRIEGEGTSAARTRCSMFPTMDTAFLLPTCRASSIGDSRASTAVSREPRRAWGCILWPSCARRWGLAWRSRLKRVRERGFW